jgi:hypothetical protein
VFFVLYAICMFVFFNNLVIVLVSLPIYVNVVHFLFLFLWRVGCRVYVLFFLLLCVYLRWIIVVM